MSALARIALVVDSSRAYGRGICQGVAQFGAAQGDWQLFHRDIRVDITKISTWLKSNRIDGIITYVPNRQLFTGLCATGLPVVDVTGLGGHPEVTTFATDPVGVARLAADFFQQAKFTNFAFCGYPGVFFSDQREKAFRDILWERQKTVYAQPSSRIFTGDDCVRSEQDGEETDLRLCDWLRKLPKPVAILACNDVRGQQIINACREVQLDVPGDVVVLGVDNDDLAGALCQPMLSSIEPDTRGIGYSAARELARLLGGGEKAAICQNIAPLRVVERQSTNVLPTEQPLLAEASRLIQENFCKNINAKKLCVMMGLQRQTLDMLFVRHLGRTAAEEICRVRLKYATGLLRETSLSLTEIAQQCGFPTSPHICRFVRRETGMTPLRLRQQAMSVAPSQKPKRKNKKAGAKAAAAVPQPQA